MGVCMYEYYEYYEFGQLCCKYNSGVTTLSHPHWTAMKNQEKKKRKWKKKQRERESKSTEKWKEGQRSKEDQEANTIQKAIEHNPRF